MGSIPIASTNGLSVCSNKTDRYKNQSENKIWLIFLLLKNNIKIIQNERMMLEMKITKQEL